MIVVNNLIWDDWNKSHLAKHRITPDEVEEVCHSKHKTGESYRNRLVLEGKTKSGKLIAIVLSTEVCNYCLS